MCFVVFLYSRICDCACYFYPFLSLYIYFGFIYYSFGGEESIRLIVKEGEKKNPHIFEE